MTGNNWDKDLSDFFRLSGTTQERIDNCPELSRDLLSSKLSKEQKLERAKVLAETTELTQKAIACKVKINRHLLSGLTFFRDRVEAERIEKLRRLILQPGMTNRQLRRALGILQMKTLSNLAGRAGVDLSELPLGERRWVKKRRLPKRLCPRCRKRRIRARGFCKNCSTYLVQSGQLPRVRHFKRAS